MIRLNCVKSNRFQHRRLPGLADRFFPIDHLLRSIGFWRTRSRLKNEAVAAGAYSVRAYGKVISISATNPVSAQTLDTVSEDPISALAASSVHVRWG